MVYCYFLQNFCVFIKVFHFTVFLNEMYTCTIRTEEGLMKIEKSGFDQKQISEIKNELGNIVTDQTRILQQVS